MKDVGLVEKQVFTLERCTTLGGATLKDVRVGWESYGRLNADKSNAILVTHYFSGTSHAAGRYAATDTLTNLNAYDPNVVTTGPASIDPDTGRPYGMSFPVVQIGDFVNVQKALVE